MPNDERWACKHTSNATERKNVIHSIYFCSKNYDARVACSMHVTRILIEFLWCLNIASALAFLHPHISCVNDAIEPDIRALCICIHHTNVWDCLWFPKGKQSQINKIKSVQMEKMSKFRIHKVNLKPLEKFVLSFFETYPHRSCVGDARWRK